MSRSFAENLAMLPAADGLAGIELIAPDGSSSRIENKPGSQGSLRLYRFLFEKYGEIDAVAAEAGLALYAEHVAEAREHPGRHPTIDRLIGIVACKPALAVRLLREED
jgi:hypothetical protein